MASHKDWKEYRREYGRARYAKLKNLGICAVCGKNDAVEGKALCQVCRDKRAKGTRRPQKPKVKKPINSFAEWKRLKKAGLL